MLTDDKTNRVIDDITKRFKYQPNPNSCEPTCIYNVLHELGDRDSRREIQFSEARVQFSEARRSGDPTLRRHLRSFALFLVSLIVFGVSIQSFSAYASTDVALGTLIVDSIFVAAAYFLYSSARSLAPLNKLTLSE
jgi:hypothetical protein